MTSALRVAYVIGFSAPPVLHLDEFLVLLSERGWDSYVILSPTAAVWADAGRLAEVSGHPVRVEPRTPHEEDPLPPADAVIAAPLTFNSLNKWAAGISDTLALGLLNEALGLQLPITAAPCIKEALRRHPIFERNLRLLGFSGVKVVEAQTAVGGPPSSRVEFNWRAVLPS